jgi:hypothetical protein
MVPPSAWAPEIDQDEIVLCNANDAEITGNLMAYQLKINVQDADEHLFVQRLVPDPPSDDIRPETVFFGARADLGGGLPPLGDSHNGPEIGHDGTYGWEVVYTIADHEEEDHWNVAWQSNSCFFWLGDVDWAQCWAGDVISNDEELQNRWFPFATAVWQQAAKVVYFPDD